MRWLDFIKSVRQDISDYCIYNCDADCCHGNSQYGIPLPIKTIERLYGKKIGEITAPIEPIEPNPLTGEFMMGVLRGTCPRLKDNLCTLIDNPKRPHLCRQYPIFCEDEYLTFINSNCRYIKENFLQIFTRWHELPEKVRQKKGIRIVVKSRIYNPETDLVAIASELR